MSGVLTYADERGRDGFAFQPIESRYLEVADDLRIRTPYSRTVVDELRLVPWAWWDGDLKGLAGALPIVGGPAEAMAHD
jgi:hypothetical protein